MALLIEVASALARGSLVPPYPADEAMTDAMNDAANDVDQRAEYTDGKA
jgi:hypothetical protein